MRWLAAAAVALAGVALALILAPERRPASPPPRSEAPVESIESAPPAAVPPSPPPPPETPAPLPLPVPEPPPRGPIEMIQSSPHSQVMQRLIDLRLDDVDRCRDRLTLPPLQQLLPRSTVVPEGGVNTGRVQEASLQQTFVFQVSTSNDAYWIDSAEVIESSLEFPAPDGTLRRTSFDDPTLDRCVEGALCGSKVESNGVPDGQRFWVQGPAGEAVYDLPAR
jgi:hypothetical protein